MPFQAPRLAALKWTIPGVILVFCIAVIAKAQNYCGGIVAIIGPTPTTVPYQMIVENDSPAYYWRLNETSGTVAADSVDTNPGTYTSIASLGNPGSPSTGDGAAGFNGTSSHITTTAQIAAPGNNGYSLEAWFKVSSTQSGPLISFTNAQAGNGTSYDRQIYLGTDGKVYFGQYFGSVIETSSTNTYNDSHWHYTLGVYDPTAADLTLYVDCSAVETASVGGTTPVTGWWSIGTSPENGWTNAGTGQVFYNGLAQEIAVYNHPLTAQQELNHCSTSMPTPTPTPALANARFGNGQYGNFAYGAP